MKNSSLSHTAHAAIPNLQHTVVKCNSHVQAIIPLMLMLGGLSQTCTHAVRISYVNWQGSRGRRAHLEGHAVHAGPGTGHILTSIYWCGTYICSHVKHSKHDSHADIAEMQCAGHHGSEDRQRGILCERKYARCIHCDSTLERRLLIPSSPYLFGASNTYGAVAQLQWTTGRGDMKYMAA